jgi:hypothetical protein
MGASSDARTDKEHAMDEQQGHWIVAAVAAAAIAASLAGAATVRAAEHHHDDAAVPQALSLDHGRPWATDASLREGMGRIRGLVDPQLAAAHAGKLGATQYRALATQVETEVGGIVANCKLEPKADAMLHRVIAQIGAGTEAMAGKDAKQRPDQGLLQVAQAVNDYARTFDHPGFAPLRLPH